MKVIAWMALMIGAFALFAMFPILIPIVLVAWAAIYLTR
jgi:hypothetical protein